eukprot:1183228-Prorocentrum_minimum.AAC.1
MPEEAGPEWMPMRSDSPRLWSSVSHVVPGEGLITPAAMVWKRLATWRGGSSQSRASDTGGEERMVPADGLRWSERPSNVTRRACQRSPSPFVGSKTTSTARRSVCAPAACTCTPTDRRKEARYPCDASSETRGHRRRSSPYST